MDIGLFIKSLDEKEKVQLLTELQKETEGARKDTDIIEWCERVYNTGTMTTRLKNIIWMGFRKGQLLEDVTIESFFNKRNAGVKTWQEFIQLRGY